MRLRESSNVSLGERDSSVVGASKFVDVAEVDSLQHWCMNVFDACASESSGALDGSQQLRSLRSLD